MEKILMPRIGSFNDPVISFDPVHKYLSELQVDYVPETATLPIHYPVNNFTKRLIDIIISLIVIILVLSWLLPILAVLIKLHSRGPVFFIQKRNTIYGRIFSCIKLRTMYINSEADQVAARENDKRITKTGSWLRKFHLDELPQFFNVLIGDMSLIGPRPYMIAENKYYGRLLGGFEFRHSVKPGISGLAQSYGQFGNIKDLDMMRSRLALDHHYILHWSLSLDLKIALRTLMGTIRSN